MSIRRDCVKVHNTKCDGDVIELRIYISHAETIRKYEKNVNQEKYLQTGHRIVDPGLLGGGGGCARGGSSSLLLHSHVDSSKTLVSGV